MTRFEETLEYLYERLPMYQRIGKSAFKKDLTNTLELLQRLENPHRKFKSVHIAGTNGKGTSAHAIAAILQSAGYKTGLYTSPHLKKFTERIKINGREMPEKEVVSFVDAHRDLIESINPSFFETTVAMAFDYFATKSVDIAVIETGLGGRLDSTNVIMPEVCLITNIGLEHTDLLGDTIEKIAFEKAGIIKERVSIVIGNLQDEAEVVIREIAQSRSAKVVRSRVREGYPKSNIPYFEKNLPGVIGVIEELKIKGWKIPEKSIHKGLKQFQSITGLKGRFQLLSSEPWVLADVSHNKDGLEVLFEGIKEAYPFDKLFVIFGTVKDKNLDDLLTIMPTYADYFFCESSVPRSLAAEEVQQQFRKVGITGQIIPDVNMAIKKALERADDDDLIVITGSTFLVAEIDNL